LPGPTLFAPNKAQQNKSQWQTALSFSCGTPLWATPTAGFSGFKAKEENSGLSPSSVGEHYRVMLSCKAADYSLIPRPTSHPNARNHSFDSRKNMAPNYFGPAAMSSSCLPNSVQHSEWQISENSFLAPCSPIYDLRNESLAHRITWGGLRWRVLFFYSSKTPQSEFF
jgi:hypothetical protein